MKTTRVKNWKQAPEVAHIFHVYSWVTSQKPPRQKPPDNKPRKIIQETIAKYAVDANIFRLGSTSPKKNPAPGFF